MSEAMREAFEAHLRSLPGFTPSELSKTNGEYADPHTAAVWIGWQAALSGAQQGEAPQPAQVPEGWMFFPVEAWRFLTGEAALAGVHFGETVSDDKTGRAKPFWWRSHIRHMLAAAPSGDANHFTENSRPIDDAMVGLPNGSFKAFHASLCRRFGYPHDEQYWWRDLVSLEEHMAAGFGDAKRKAETVSRKLFDFANEVVAGNHPSLGEDHVPGIRAAAQMIANSERATRLRQSDSEEETHA